MNLIQEEIILDDKPTDICINNSSVFSACGSRTWLGKFDYTIELYDELTIPNCLLINNKITSYFKRLDPIENSNNTSIWAKTYSLLNENSVEIGQLTFRPIGGACFSLCQLSELDQINIEIQREFAGEGSVAYFPSELCNQSIEAERAQRFWSLLPRKVQKAFESINEAPISTEVFHGHSEVAFLIRIAILESNLNPRTQNAYGHKGLYQIGFSVLRDIGVVKGDDWENAKWTTTSTQPKSLNEFLNNPYYQIECIKKIWNHQFNSYLRHYFEIRNIDVHTIMQQESISFNLKETKSVSKPSGIYVINAGTYTTPATKSALIAFTHLSGAEALADFISEKWNNTLIDQHGTIAWEYAKKMEIAPDGEPYDVSGIIESKSKTLLPSFQSSVSALYREGRGIIQSGRFQKNSYLPLRMSWGNYSNPCSITMGPKQGCIGIAFPMSNKDLKIIMGLWVKSLVLNMEPRHIYRVENDKFLLLIEGALSADSVEEIKNNFNKLF